jgi:catechol 2,3-dioxygenase-like lactoylglutathione lyase family enzyme
MRLSHVNVTIPRGAEDVARRFYGELLGLREIPKPAPLRERGGVWFDAGGLDLHISVEEDRAAIGPDQRRHFGLECANVDAIRERLAAAGVTIDPGRPAPWKRFFAIDPFGNRIEIHEAGAMRS